MPRPLLGITACSKIVGPETVHSTADRYVDASTRHANCAAMLIPAKPGAMRAEEVADRIDGLLLTGSPSNIAPQLYGDPMPDAGPSDVGRDQMSLALIKAMAAQGKPIFGICRGLQEINVALGGTLVRDLHLASRPLQHHAPDDASFAAMFSHHHTVRLNPEGIFAGASGSNTIRVNSVHYQGIGNLAPPLIEEGIAEDGLIEAVSGTIGSATVIAVQWHPEWPGQDKIASEMFFDLLGRAMRGETYDALKRQRAIA